MLIENLRDLKENQNIYQNLQNENQIILRT